MLRAVSSGGGGVTPEWMENMEEEIEDLQAHDTAQQSTEDTHAAQIAALQASDSSQNTTLGTHATQIAANASAITALQTGAVKAATLTTNASGQVTWTFPTPFAAVPVISADVITTANQPYSVRLVSLSASAVTLQILGASAVTLLGISVLAALLPVGAGIPVHVFAVKAT